MSSTEENKKRWKQEAEQLKKDLNNKKKVIKKREVSIKFPKKNTIKDNKKTSTSIPSTTQDMHIKNLINFTD